MVASLGRKDYLAFRLEFVVVNKKWTIASSLLGNELIEARNNGRI
jgi:hypothetical protein